MSPNPYTACCKFTALAVAALAAGFGLQAWLPPPPPDEVPWHRPAPPGWRSRSALTFRGKPLDHWRLLVKTYGFRLGGWGFGLTFPEGGREVNLFARDPGSGEVTPLLMALLEDDDPAVRCFAAPALVGFCRGRRAEAIGALSWALGDPVGGVRWEAAHALLRFGNPPLLCPALEQAARAALGRGPGDGWRGDWRRMRLTGAELARLEDHPFLYWLSAAPDVADADLAHLARFRSLMVLDLSGTRVTDAGLGHLAGLPELGRLDLSYTRVTDAGLDRLRAVPRLRKLWLAGTGVTDAGVVRLREALPELLVER